MQFQGGGRAEHQLACLTPIARARSLSEAQRFLLFNVVRTYLQLTGAAARQHEALLAQRRHREVRNMIMTWADQMVAQGRQEGRQEGIRDLVIHLLARRFSPLPAAVSRHVSAIQSAEELTRLADRILDARSLDELGLA